MPLPASATDDFRQLLALYRRSTIAFPVLKRVTAAQWALESGWGTSDLARKHRNYGGAKWRKYMAHWATPVSYDAHDGRTGYCHFDTHAAWIAGYWGRLDVEPAYKGWRDHTIDGPTFIRHIGPTWVGTGPAGEREYVRKVLAIDSVLADIMETANEDPQAHGDGSAAGAPWSRMLGDADHA